MGRRGQTNRSGGGSRGGRGRSSSKSNSMPMVLGLIGVVAVIALVFFFMGGDEQPKKSEDTTKTKETAAQTGSNLDQKVETAAATASSNKGPENAYDRAKNAKYDMNVLKPLLAKVDMTKWQKIDQYISDAYALKADAEKARAGGSEDQYKALATKAMDTWRKGDHLFEDFQFEITGIHPDLWDACFKKEEQRYANSQKAFRSLIPYETKKH